MGMVACAGISWALTLWAPFALIAQSVSHIQDVSRRESLASSRSATPDLRPVDGSPYGSTVGNGPRVTERVSANAISGISITEERRPSMSTPVLAPQARPVVVRNALFPPSSSPGVKLQSEKNEITSAGAIMGLHNVFISSPQFISTFLASIIFHFLGAGGRGDDIHPDSIDPSTSDGWGGGSIAWVLRVGGLGGLVAAYLAWGLKEEKEEFGDEIMDRD